MQNISDEIVMENVKDGKISDMSILFERYYKKIYNFFLRMGLKKDISQDLTQNLFYRMIRYKHTYKNGSSVKSWIYQIARNLHSDYCKQKKKTGDLFVNTEVFPSDLIDETHNYQEEDFEKLDRAFSSLSNAQKEIIVLSRFQGLKYEEISSIIDQSVPAIKVAMFRAVKQLRCIYFKQI